MVSRQLGAIVNPGKVVCTPGEGPASTMKHVPTLGVLTVGGLGVCIAKFVRIVDQSAPIHMGGKQCEVASCLKSMTMDSIENSQANEPCLTEP